jgi:hypothetical protein
MKKLITLSILFLTIISCSSDDDDDVAIQNESNFINPPEWIIGTWLDESEPVSAQIGGFQFTTNNLIFLAADGNVLSNLKEGLQESVDFGVITTNETITDTYYKLEIVLSGTVTNTFEFTKGTGDTTIIYDLSATFDVILTKQ